MNVRVSQGGAWSITGMSEIEMGVLYEALHNIKKAGFFTEGLQESNRRYDLDKENIELKLNNNQKNAFERIHGKISEKWVIFINETIIKTLEE